MPDDLPEAGARCGVRRRGDVLEHAIFDAVLDQLATVGYEGLTMEGVAACSRTGKASLYRRWPSKDSLIADAVGHRVPPVDDPPDTGSVRGDLRVLLGRMAENLNSPTGCAMQKLLGSVDREGDVIRVISRQLIEPRERLLLDLLRRGVARGEVRDGAATPMAAKAGPALVIYHYLTSGPPVTDDVLAGILDDVLMPVLQP